MLTIIRKNQQFLMTIVVFLTIISFAWLYNRTNLNQVGSNDVLSIYGKVIQQEKIDRLARGYQLALALGLTDFVRDLGGLEASEEVSLNNFILNLLLAQHQAEELGIRPSDESVLSAMKTLAPLQTDGAFDPAKYAAFVQEQLAPRGFTELQLEDIVRDSLKVHALSRIITSPVAISEGEIRMAARIYQPISAEVIKFDRTQFEKNLSITPAEISAFYEKNKAAIRKDEARSFSYVILELPDDQQVLSGKEKTLALQRLADQAVAVGKAIRDDVAKGEEFTKSAQKAALHPEKAVAVQRNGRQDDQDSGLPDAALAATFRQQKKGEVSDIIQDGDSFYIVSLDEIIPSHQMELAEVAEKISKLLLSEKANKAVMDAAGKSLTQLRAALAAGKSFVEAAKQAGITTELLNGIVPDDAKLKEEERALATATLSLKDGELGVLQPAPWGAFAIYLDKRTPLTDAQWKEHQDEMSKKLLGKDQGLLFREWLNQTRGTAQIKSLRKQRSGS